MIEADMWMALAASVARAMHLFRLHGILMAHHLRDRLYSGGWPGPREGWWSAHLLRMSSLRGHVYGISSCSCYLSDPCDSGYIRTLRHYVVGRELVGSPVF